MGEQQVAVQQQEVQTLPRIHIPALQPILYYPDSDGEPMAEHDPQYRCITDTRFALEERYRHDDRVYVGADLLLYYAEGDPYKSVAPDLFVAFGVPKGHRRNYLLWKEGKAPDVVFEIASAGTWQADLTWKRGLYQGLDIQEYFLFDPLAEYLDPLLQGYCLEGGVYVRLTPLPGGERGVLGLASRVLNLELWARPDGGEGMPYVLRLYDPQAGIWLPTPAEEAEARRAAEARAAHEAQARRAAEARATYEAQARRAAEARIAELEAELQRLRGEHPA